MVPINGLKRRRRFKRIYLQPQPKQSRKSKGKEIPSQGKNLPQGWNGVLKNLSDEPVTKVEENLFLEE